MIASVQSDFYTDFQNCVKAALDKSNLKYSPDDASIVFKYFELLRRIPSATPRKLFWSQDVESRVKDYPAIKNISSLLESGGSVVPYLHRKIRTFDYHDKLLNDWNIYHFHLGETVDKDGFAKRTSEVLYVYMESTNAYLLSVSDHKTINSVELFHILKRNWPDVVEKYELKIHSPKNSTTDEQVAHFRSLGVMSPITVDGKTYIGPGQGYSISGQSTKATWDAAVYIDKLRQVEKQVKAKINEIYEPLAVPNKESIVSVRLRLVVGDDGSLTVLDEENSVSIAVEVK